MRVDPFDIFICSTIICNIAILIGWGIITWQRSNEGRGWYNDATVSYAVSYFLLAIGNLYLIKEGGHHLSVFDACIRFAVYAFQLYATYKIIWVGKKHPAK